MIVLDASVLANALADDGAAGDHARAALRGERDPAAPELIDAEAMHVFRKLWLAGGLSVARFRQATHDLAWVSLRRYPLLPLVGRAFELRTNVTAYDAMYIALAEALDCELLTGDRRLAAAPGIGCAVRVLAQPI